MTGKRILRLDTIVVLARMTHYAWIDVSLETSSICIVDT
jgi:hypothetical protein